MIRGFADRGTEEVYNGVRTPAARRCIPPALWALAQRKLDRLHRATELRDLFDPPGNRLEPLLGERAGFYSIRLNERYRIVFRFDRGSAEDVAIVDYH